MRPSISQTGARGRGVRWALLPAIIALFAAVDLPEKAAAAPCPVVPGNATAWTGASGNGSFGDSGNWSNGTPSGSCDVTVAPLGSPTITMTGGANTRSFTLGGSGSTPKLVISVQGPNTNLDAQPAGITIAQGASVVLTCPPSPGECAGGSGSGAHIYSGPSTFVNAGTITVDPNSGTGAQVGGVITNTATGAITFEKDGALSGQVINKGSILVKDGATAFNQGSSCGGTEPFVKNDTGGTISGEGTGALSVYNFEQGAGTTEDVVIPCGSLKYTGGGSSEVLATGGFNLTGEQQENQELTVSANSTNTYVFMQGDFTSHGDIALTCPEGGCSGSGGGPGGGVAFNANGHVFTNDGTLSFAPASGTDAGTTGGMTNTGTISFEQSGNLSGVVTNKGTIEIASGEVATSSTSSCGDSGPRVINGTGGKVVGIGTGTLSAVNFEQGAGITVGSAPVTMNCGSLKYVGAGASLIRVPSSATMTGNLAVGQTLGISGQVNNGAFTNAGTIVLDQSASNPNLNAGKVTNTGKIEVAGGSANSANVANGIEQTGSSAEIVVPAGTQLNSGAAVLLKAGALRGAGTIGGSVENIGGVVAPGASPGTLTTTGSYTQGPGGRLDIEIAGTGAGQFDRLAVGGVTTLGGTLALIPSSDFAGSAALGDSVSFLAYGSSASGGFSQMTVSPSLSCGKAFSISTDSGAKALKATVVAGGTPCSNGGGGTVQNPPPAPPIAPTPPKQTCPKGEKLKKGKCVRKTCPKGKKLKKGRCVKKKQPKARSRRS